MRTAASWLGGIGAVVVVVGSAGCAFFQPAPTTGTTTLTSGTTDDPCRGKRFDADAADARCLEHATGTPSPVPVGLRIELPTAPVVKSGEDARLFLSMTNTTSEPLTVEVDDSCGTFEAQASNASTSSFHSDCFGVCGNSPEPRVLRVTLEPGGIVHKKVKFSAVQTTTALDARDECVASTVGGLPPGDYALRVTLPWTDPIADHPDVTRPRVLEGKITVTP